MIQNVFVILVLILLGQMAKAQFPPNIAVQKQQWNREDEATRKSRKPKEDYSLEDLKKNPLSQRIQQKDGFLYFVDSANNLFTKSLTTGEIDFEMGNVRAFVLFKDSYVALGPDGDVTMMQDGMSVAYPIGTAQAIMATATRLYAVGMNSDLLVLKKPPGFIRDVWWAMTSYSKFDKTGVKNVASLKAVPQGNEVAIQVTLQSGMTGLITDRTTPKDLCPLVVD
jgi:hypothetical protein